MGRRGSGSNTADFRSAQRKREYWLIDPLARTAEFYRLGRDGKYHLVAPEPGGTFRSLARRGFWIEVGWLWSPPTLREIRALWGIA